MKLTKKILTKLFYPHLAFTLPAASLAAAFLIYSFAAEGVNPRFQYFSYFFSAYALTILCIAAPRILAGAKRLRHSGSIARFFDDAAFRLRCSLYFSLGMNLIFCLMQLWLGLESGSFWYYSLAAYYLLLSLMRFFLLKEALRRRLGEDPFFELLIYRFCGCLLVPMNTALSVMVYFIVRLGRGQEHHYILVIAMAACCFSSLAAALTGVIRSKKHRSPLMEAAKKVSLISAAVSMLSLETAMLSAFSDGDPVFRRIITGSSGTVLCILVLYLAVEMIISSSIQINKLKGEK